MNFLSKKNIYARSSNIKPNTYIGGIASIINTKALLASKLGISQSSIKLFRIVNADIEANISVNYTPINLAFSTTPITFYNDIDGLCVAAVGSMFFNCTSLEWIHLPSITTLGFRFCRGCTSLISVYAPSLTGTLSNEAFYGCRFNSIDLGTITTIGDSALYDCINLKNVYSIYVTSILNSALRGCLALETAGFPNLNPTGLGTTLGGNNIFFNIKTGCVISIPISLMTVNSGLPDGDLTYASGTRQAVINYIGTQPPVNFKIGNLANTFGSANAIGTKLGLGGGARITNFKIVGTDLHFYVVGDFNLPTFVFNADPNLTFIEDLDGRIKEVSAGFSSVPLCRTLYLPGLTIYHPVPSNWSLQQSPNLKTIYAPLCMLWGSSVGFESNFFRNNFVGRSKIYVHPSMATINGGVLEGDLNYAQTSLGCTIHLVNNFTKPSQISTLNLDHATNNSLNISWTIPSATNAVDYYEIYVNGIYLGKSIVNNFMIPSLESMTNYQVSVRVIDALYNFSDSIIHNFSTL